MPRITRNVVSRRDAGAEIEPNIVGVAIIRMRDSQTHPCIRAFKKELSSTTQIRRQEHADPETTEPVTQTPHAAIGLGAESWHRTPGAGKVGHVWEFLNENLFILVDLRDQQVQSLFE